MKQNSKSVIKSLRIPRELYDRSSIKVNTMYNGMWSGYINNLIESDINNRAMNSNRKEFISNLGAISSIVNHLVDEYSDDQGIREMKERVNRLWQIL